MRKKTASEPQPDNYPASLARFCREGDVMIIPSMVTHYLSHQVAEVVSYCKLASIQTPILNLSVFTRKAGKGLRNSQKDQR